MFNYYHINRFVNKISHEKQNIVDQDLNNNTFHFCHNIVKCVRITIYRKIDNTFFE